MLQYQIEFSSSYVLEAEAEARLLNSRRDTVERTITNDDESVDSADVDYEQMRLHERRYLCSIPRAKVESNVTDNESSPEDHQKELTRAADRGWQLLQDMEGKQCLYYSTGWWSYSFCYNSHVKQFHSLPPSPGGARAWPPQEDQATPSYFLGKYDRKNGKQESLSSTSKREIAELQSRADGNYLVQKLEGGTPCDLTGKNRKVEIEFHCHPQTTDRIGWIKETTTCAYLMVIYTPRLCNDVAFQPPRESQAHTIKCQEILSIPETADLHELQQEAGAIEENTEKPIMIGNIELGSMKIIGKEAKKLERGRIVMTTEEKAETVMMQKDGQVQGLSRTKMKELNLKPEDIEDFRKELQKVAGTKDWKIERLEDPNGQIRLLGIVSTDGNEERYEAAKDESEEKKESEDVNKQEL